MEAVTAPAAVWLSTRFSSILPARCATTVGISSTVTTTSNSHSWPKRSGAGMTKCRPPVARSAEQGRPARLGGSWLARVGRPGAGP